MALDRQTIEKRDFPIGRRGYDPEAVDAHLGKLADEVATLQRQASSHDGPAPAAAAANLADVASQQVRLIVEAAEQSAAEIERDADREATRLRDEARRAADEDRRAAQADAERARTEAADASRGQVARVSEATTSMLERVDQMETELSSTLETLRTGVARLTSDLALLQDTVGELRGSPAGPTVVDESTVPADVAPEPAIVDDGEVLAEDLAEDEVVTLDEDEPVTLVEEEVVVVEADEVVATEAGGDEEGARLIALNMALNGSPRGEVEQYLAENFDLPDAGALLDDVYARVG